MGALIPATMRIAQGVIALRRGADAVALAQVFDADGDIVHRAITWISAHAIA